MKNKLIILTAIILISITVAGKTMAWLTSTSEASLTNIEMGIVKVEVTGNELEDIRVRSLGTSDSYIRVRLVPQWDNPNLSIANIKINVAQNWIERDGYYYYSQPLKENEITSNLIAEIIIADSTSEYEGATFKFKIVAEGVQTTENAWENVWSINSLPF